MKEKPYIFEKINGIPTVFFPLEDKEAILAEVWIKAGSQNEGEKWGAFHLLEHMCHQGTQKFSTANKAELYKENHGLRANAFTSNDKIGFWCKGPHYELKSILTYLNQIVFQPTIPQAQMAKEIGVIKQEYHDAWDSPFRRFDRSIDHALFGQDHPYTKDALGQPEFVASQTREDLLKLHQKYFTADNIILVIAGKFEPQKARKLIEELIRPPLTAKRKPLALPPVNTSKEINSHFENMAQNRLVLSWVIPGIDKLSLRQRMALLRGNYILGGSARSILFKEVREKRGLAYSPSSHIHFYPRLGDFEISVSTQPENKEKTLKLLRQILKNFLSKPISAPVFARANAYLTAQYLMTFDSLGDYVDYVLSDLFYEKEIILPNEFLEMTQTITKEEVEQEFRKLIDANKGLLSIMTKAK